MPWCPKCKNEYREGIQICADCGCELISEEAADRVAILFGEKEKMERLKGFLEYNQITSSRISFIENENVYELSVACADKELAKKSILIFVQQEAEREAASCEAQREQEAEEEPETAASGLTYESNEQRARDNKSSAVVLFLIGGAGLVFLALCIAGILPFSFRGIVYGVMGALFLIFIILGFVSMKNFKELSQKAASENSLVDSMTKWCLENLKASEWETDADGDTADESLTYFKRVNWMKEKIQNQFLNLDESFLEHFIDDIYDDIFEK